jgi:hypothetical protein
MSKKYIKNCRCDLFLLSDLNLSDDTPDEVVECVLGAYVGLQKVNSSNVESEKSETKDRTTWFQEMMRL